MSAARRHKKHHHEEHENHERWLVSGYDMMTLLFAVFVVLFAISSTNVSKVKLLEQSLQEAFSGPVLTGGRAMMKTGDQSEAPSSRRAGAAAALAVARAGRSQEAMSRRTPRRTAEQAQAEESRASRTSRSGSTSWPRTPAWPTRCRRPSRRDGLKIRLMTDGVLFDSGSAVDQPGRRPHAR